MQTTTEPIHPRQEGNVIDVRLGNVPISRLRDLVNWGNTKGFVVEDLKPWGFQASELNQEPQSASPITLEPSTPANSDKASTAEPHVDTNIEEPTAAFEPAVSEVCVSPDDIAPEIAVAVETAPVVTAPVVSAPVVTAPVVSAPVVTAPVVAAPVVTEPVVTAPVVTAPVVTAPVVAAPVVTAPVVTAPVVTAPVVTAPVVTAPVVTAPVVATPVVAAQIAGNQVVTAPSVAKPAISELSITEPVEPTPVLAAKVAPVAKASATTTKKATAQSINEASAAHIASPKHDMAFRGAFKSQDLANVPPRATTVFNAPAGELDSYVRQLEQLVIELNCELAAVVSEKGDENDGTNSWLLQRMLSLNLQNMALKSELRQSNKQHEST